MSLETFRLEMFDYLSGKMREEKGKKLKMKKKRMRKNGKGKEKNAKCKEKMHPKRLKTPFFLFYLGNN